MKYKNIEISERVIQRLTEYLSILKEARKSDEYINSIELATKMKTTSAQVRKDLSTFGEFGVRGKGYQIDILLNIIEDILGINKNTNVIIVGYGKMGNMLANNKEVLGKGFKIVGIFDNDKNKIGEKIEQLDITVEDVNKLDEFIKNFDGKIDTAILSVTREQALASSLQLVNNGIKAILNMTTQKLELPSKIIVVDMDISAKLQELNFWKNYSKNTMNFK